MSREADISMQLARAVVQEDANALKIVVIPDRRVAGFILEILVRSFHIPRKEIIQLGYTASDEQNNALLRGRSRIVLVPKDMLRHRPCTFYPPVGSKHVVLIDGTRATIEVRHMSCGDGPFELVWSTGDVNRASFNEAIDKLVSLYHVHPEGFLKGSPERCEVRRIGEMLSEMGGLPLMQTAHSRFAYRCKTCGAARNLESVWDGIGSWQG